VEACELKIDLLCQGLRIDPSAAVERDGRPIARTRAGLGSGLELVLHGRRKSFWVNAPVVEPFAARSPWLLVKEGDHYFIEGCGDEHPVLVPEAPAWYDARTSAGTPMSRIGVLQGTYLAIYLEKACAFWRAEPSLQCRFCTTGLNVGAAEQAEKSVEDVVETALAAKAESGVTFVHLNSGFQGERDVDAAGPFVKALKERVGVLVGLQMAPSRHSWKYDWLRDLGVDHFSFCPEFRSPEYFARLLPGKQKVFGPWTFWGAIGYTARLLGPGRVSGEIIAGVEPLDETLRAIDEIVDVGAFPTVCIFRPLVGSMMADHPPPRPHEMRVVFRHVAEACRRAGLPVGIAPNVEVSIVVTPDDALDLLSPRELGTWAYRAKLGLARAVARPLLARSLRPHAVAASDEPPRHAPD
jgi:hypothetical protein